MAICQRHLTYCHNTMRDSLVRIRQVYVWVLFLQFPNSRFWYLKMYIFADICGVRISASAKKLTL